MTTPWTSVDHAALARELGAARAAEDGPALERLAHLVGVVHRLRDPDGCPWDREQTLGSMVGNLQEEAAETADAVAAGDLPHACEELGDVLMNVVLMARIAAQDGAFDLGAVAEGIAEKLVRRHPHVFGDAEAGDPDEALASWNASKEAEGRGRESALDGVPASLPALLLALKTGKKAAGTGFDWPDVGGALEKLAEEVGELEEACDGVGSGDGAGVDRAAEELGDVLFAAVNVARKLDLDPEVVLRRAVGKFRRRFAAVEAGLGERLGSAPLDEMEALWRRAAAAEG